MDRTQEEVVPRAAPGEAATGLGDCSPKGEPGIPGEVCQCKLLGHVPHPGDQSLWGQGPETCIFKSLVLGFLRHSKV